MKIISFTSKVVLIIFSVFISFQQLSAQIIVGLSTQRTISADHFGMNGQNIYSTNGSWDNPDLQDKLIDFGSSAFRFPGGTNSNWANWQTGWFRDQSEIDDCFTTPENYHNFENLFNGIIDNTITEYAKSVHKNNATSFDNLNLLTSDINTEAARLIAEQESNIPLKYVEFGNEFYTGNCEHVQKYHDGTQYANTVNSWSSDLKSLLGTNFKIGIVGALAGNNADARELNWNSQVLQGLNTGSADAVTLHRYSGAGITNNLSPANINAMLLQPWRAVDGQNGLKKEINTIHTVLGANQEIWITEFDLFEKDYAVHGSWAHGLFAAHLALKMLECPDVKHELNHAMIGNHVFGDMFEGNVDFIVGSDFKDPEAPCNGCPLPATLPHTYTAKGLALRLISQAMKNCNQATQLSFPSSPNLGSVAVWPNGNVNVPVLYGWMFENTNTTSAEAIILNMSAVSQTLDITGLPAFDGVESIDADPFGFVFASGPTIYNYFIPCSACPIMPSPGVVQFSNPIIGSNQVSLPAYSITRLHKCAAANTVSLQAATNPVCNNGTTSIYADGSSELTYIWSTGATTSVIEAGAGTYTVTITDCNSVSSTQSITITNYPTHSISFSPASLSVCPDGTSNHVTITATLSGGGTNQYAWITAPGFIDGITNGLSNSLEVEPATTTTYTVYATDGTCGTHADYTVNVNPKITLEKDHTICINKPYIFNPIPLTGSYQWFENGSLFSNSPSPIINPLTNFINNYSVLYTDGSGCSSEENIRLTAVNCCNETNHFPSLTTADDIVAFFQANTAFATISTIPPQYFDFEITATATGAITNFEFEGEVILDKRIMLCGFQNLKFDEAAQVIIEPYNALYLKGCNLSACSTNLWKGIHVQRFGNVYTQIDASNIRTTISDAELAIQAENGSFVSLKNTDFANNYIGVFIPPIDILSGAQYQNEIEFTSTGNNYTCPTPLLNPYYLQVTPSATHSFAGINFNDMSSVIGNSGSPINTFSNLNNGILGINSSLLVTNSYFADIKDYDSYSIPINGNTGTGIYSAADYGKYASLTEQGLGIAQMGWNHTFDNCLIGVCANNASLNMSFNHMSNMVVGAMAINNKLTNIEISYNEIEAGIAGIVLDGNDASRRVNVEQNLVFSSTTLTQHFWGIVARDFSSAPTARRTYSIHCNNVSGDFDKQIEINTIGSISLRNNNSWLNTGSGLGISLYGCTNGVVDGNSVIGTGNGNATSFLFSLSTNTTVVNNISSDANIGFSFQGDCANSKFKINTIGVHHTGMQLNSSGVMGEQYDASTNPITVYSNQWQPDPNQIIYSSGFGAINQNAQSQSAVLQSKLFVNNQSGNPLIGDDVYPHFDVPSFSGTPWIAPYPTGTLQISTYNNDCKVFREGDGEALTLLDELIASDSIVAVDFEIETKFMTASDLLDKLYINDSLKNSSLLFQNFYSGKSMQAIGQLSKTRIAIGDIYDDDADKIEHVALNDSIIQALFFIKAVNDSMLNYAISNNDSVSLLNQISELIQQINILRLQTNSLLKQLNFERQDKINAAIALNDAVNAFTVIESNEKSINEIYLTKFVIGDFNLLSSQINSLHYVADQCPFAGGRSVYTARTMLQMMGDSNTYNDLDFCVALGYYRKRNIISVDNDNNFFISIKPNPAITLVKISYSLIENTPCKIEIRNMLGKLFLEKELQLNSYETDINLSNFDSGIYFVLFKSNSIQLSKNKLTVIK